MTAYRSCDACGQRIITARRENSKSIIILDHQPDPDGTHAAYQITPGTYRARVLALAEQPQPHEHRYSEHYATSPKCRPPSDQSRAAAADTISFLDQYRKGLAEYSKTKRNQRGRHRAKPITGYRIHPGRQQ